MEQTLGYCRVLLGECDLQTQKNNLWIQQRSRAYFEKFSTVIVGVSFRNLTIITMYLSGTSSIIFPIVYVDDILSNGTDIEGLTETKACLK